MRRVSLILALPLMLAQAGPVAARGGDPPSLPPAPTVPWATDGLEVGGVVGEAGGRRRIAEGNPELNEDLWQHTWGIAGIDAFPVGSKMAPNGYRYEPLFSLDLLLNIALVRDRTLYIFSNARFWAQKPGEGITNPKQGAFDFSKRQFDLDAGFAWNFYDNFEGRVFFYSDNNLNRGRWFDRPFGYKDGSGVELRYYFDSTDFDQGLFRFLSIGYMPTKELIGMDGNDFKPSLFLNANLAYDFIPYRLYAYFDNELIFERPFEARLLFVDPGVAFRPITRAPNMEFRIGAESTIDLVAGFTRTLLYGHLRVVW